MSGLQERSRRSARVMRHWGLCVTAVLQAWQHGCVVAPGQAPMLEAWKLLAAAHTC